jgi:hypothetical protein
MQEDFSFLQEEVTSSREEKPHRFHVHRHVYDHKYHSTMAFFLIEEGHGHMREGFLLLKNGRAPIQERELALEYVHGPIQVEPFGWTP